MTEPARLVSLIICLHQEEATGLSKVFSAVPKVRNAISRHRALVIARANPLSGTDYIKHVLETLATSEFTLNQIVIYGESGSLSLVQDAVTNQFQNVTISSCSSFHQLRSQLGGDKTAIVFYPDPLGLGQTRLELGLKLAGITQITINSRGRDISRMHARVVGSRALANSRAADTLVGVFIVILAVFFKFKDRVTES